MINTIPRMSVWELAHRFISMNPDSTDPKNLPLEVKDALRSLTRAFHYDDLRLVDFKGVENYGTYHVQTGHRYTTQEVHEQLPKCYEDLKFDKQFLETIYIENEDLGPWCVSKKIPLPSFWFGADWKPYDDGEGSESGSEERLRSNQIDKLLCQAIAKTIWDIHPVMTIAEMCKHDSIQKYGNGRLYKGAHTLRDWLSEVAPDSVKGKAGRPRKALSSEG